MTAGGIKTPASTTTTFDSVATSFNNTLIVLAASRENYSSTDGWSANWTNANLSNITKRVDTSTSHGNDGGLAVATGVKATAGSIGQTTATVSQVLTGI